MSALPQTLFIGGKVFDGHGAMLPGHGVLVEGKQVTRVAPAAEFNGFAGRRIDTTGMTLMPGMADCHVHLVYTGGADPQTQMSKQGPAQITLTALENAQAALRGGFTALRDCGGKDYLEFGVRDAIARGVFPGPTIKASGRIICMTGATATASAVSPTAAKRWSRPCASRSTPVATWSRSWPPAAS